MKRIAALFLLAVFVLALASCGKTAEFPLKARDVRKVLTIGDLENKYGEPDEIAVYQRVYSDISLGGFTGKMYVYPDVEEYSETVRKEDAVSQLAWKYEKQKGPDDPDGDLRENPSVLKIVEELDSLYGAHRSDETDPGSVAYVWNAGDGAPAFSLTFIFGESELWLQIDVGNF